MRRRPLPPPLLPGPPIPLVPGLQLPAFFLLRPRRLKSGPRPPFPLAPLPSTEAVLRLEVLPPGFASGLSIHQLDLPVPSFWTLTNLLCNDKLWRMEFCNEEKEELNTWKGDYVSERSSQGCHTLALPCLLAPATTLSWLCSDETLHAGQRGLGKQMSNIKSVFISVHILIPARQYKCR